MTTVSPVNGNGQFSRVGNTLLEGSTMLKGSRQLDPLSGARPALLPSSGVAAGTLTAAQLKTAVSGGPLGLGLLLDGSGGTYELCVAADTTAAALAIQNALDIKSVNEAKVLTFYWVDAPSADAKLRATGGTYVTVTTLAGVDNRLFESTASTGGGTVGFQAKVMISATNVTSGSEAVAVNILQAGGIAA